MFGGVNNRSLETGKDVFLWVEKVGTFSEAALRKLRNPSNAKRQTSM